MRMLEWIIKTCTLAVVVSLTLVLVVGSVTLLVGMLGAMAHG